MSFSRGMIARTATQASGGTTPSAPVLSLDHVLGYTVFLNVVFDNTVLAGDSIRRQIQAAGGDWSVLVSDTTHVITAPEDAANEADFGGTMVALGNYEARVYAIDGGVSSVASNVVPFTISSAVAPIITSSSTVNNDENAVLAHTLVSDQAVTWSIVGGDDAAKFQIFSGGILGWTSASGGLNNGTKNWEAPDDTVTDGTNTYLVTVRATNTATLYAEQAIKVTVLDLSEGTVVTTTFLGANSSGVDGTVFNFPGVSLGDAANFVVGVVSRAAATPVITSVRLHVPNIGTDPTGTAMTLIVGAGNASGNIAALYRITRPAASTGDVVITFTLTQLRCGIARYKLSTFFGTPVSALSNASPPTATLAVPVGGSAVIGIAMSASAVTATMTNLTEDHDGAIGAESASFAAGSSNTASGSTAFTITFTTHTAPSGAFAAFGP
jgi:hypothetical protein